MGFGDYVPTFDPNQVSANNDFNSNEREIN